MEPMKDADPRAIEQHGSRIIAALEHAWAAIQDAHPDVPDVVIVTGAGSGIGRATALALARDGADIAIFDVNEASAQTTLQEIEQLGRRSLALGVDDFLVKPVSARRLVASVRKLAGAAGPAGASPILVVDDDPTFRRMVVRASKLRATLSWLWRKRLSRPARALALA